MIAITTSSRLCRSLLGAAFTAALALPAHASLIYETGFTGSAGPFATAEGYSDWYVHQSSNTAPPTTLLNGDGLLQITNPNIDGVGSSAAFGGAIYTGNTSIATGQVSGILQYVAAGKQSAGFFARIQNPTANGNAPEGYFAGILRYNPGGGNRTYLVIAKDIQYAAVEGYQLASLDITSLVSSGSYYRLEFDFNASDLTATLFSTTTSTQIATISATDSTYTTGAVGLRANLGSKGQTIGFDSFEVTAIPEPSTALLLLPAGIAGAVFLRKHRSR